MFHHTKEINTLRKNDNTTEIVKIKIHFIQIKISNNNS